MHVRRQNKLTRVGWVNWVSDFQHGGLGIGFPHKHPLRSEFVVPGLPSAVYILCGLRAITQ